MSGLSPDRVSIIDSRGGLIAGGDERSDLSGQTSDRAQALKQNIERLLEARVGFGNAVVELNLETATEQESILERRFDPESRVAVSTDTQESSNTAKDGDSEGVTVASNLPDGDAAAGGSSSSNNSETRERVNYEVSETTREVVRGPGAVKRLTVAVLIDGIRSTDSNGDILWTARSEEELISLRELVEGAVGFDEARGDLITIKSLEFEPIAVDGTGPAAGFLDATNVDVMLLAQMTILAVIALLLGLFVLRPIFTAQPATNGSENSNALALPNGGETATAANLGSPITEASGLPAVVSEAGAADATLPVVTNYSGTELLDASLEQQPDPVERLRNLIAERQSDTVEILRGWMEDDEETAR